MAIDPMTALVIASAGLNMVIQFLLEKIIEIQEKIIKANKKENDILED